METVRHDVPGRQTLRRVAAVAAIVAFAVLLLMSVADAGRLIGDLGNRRDEALARRSEPVDAAGDVADAFRRFRATLHGGDRFTLVFGRAFDPDQMGTYRLVALSYLYPAVATSDSSDADAVMAFGDVPPPLLSEFEQIDVVDGVWLGRRQR